MVQSQGAELLGYAQPAPRDGHSACIFENKMYVFGGRAEQQILNDLWRIDLATLQWEELKEHRVGTPAMLGTSTSTTADDFPVQRSGHSCDIYGHYMVIFGGFMGLTKELKDLYLLDFHTLEWIKIFDEVNGAASPVAALRLSSLEKPDQPNDKKPARLNLGNMTSHTEDGKSNSPFFKIRGDSEQE